MESEEATVENVSLEELKANMTNAIMLAIKFIDREAHDKQTMIIEIPTIYDDKVASRLPDPFLQRKKTYHHSRRDRINDKGRSVYRVAFCGRLGAPISLTMPQMIRIGSKERLNLTQ